MYQSSEAFGNLVLQDSRTFKALITYDDVSITNAKSFKFTGGAEGEDDFSPVSYTHLDVYKRQDIHRALLL